jgi:hypothetical protein
MTTFTLKYRWLLFTEHGQELWQIACQWVWNLRLILGKTVQGGEQRDMEWAPAKAVPPSLTSSLVCLRLVAYLMSRDKD